MHREMWLLREHKHLLVDEMEVGVTSFKSEPTNFALELD